MKKFNFLQGFKIYELELNCSLTCKLRCIFAKSKAHKYARKGRPDSIELSNLDSRTKAVENLLPTKALRVGPFARS